jgi:isopenicillin N synthase-like dioxygenase
MRTISTPPSVPLDKLPIIDVAPLLSNDPSPEAREVRRKTGGALHQACIDYGFFYLNITAYVDSDEPQELTKLAREFFDRPQAEKDKISLSNQDHARGRLVLY